MTTVKRILDGILSCIFGAGIFAFFAPFTIHILGGEDSTAFLLPGGWRLSSGMIAGAGLGFLMGLYYAIRDVIDRR